MDTRVYNAMLSEGEPKMEDPRSKFAEQWLKEQREVFEYAAHELSLISSLLNAERCDTPVYPKSLAEHEKYKQIMANRCDICGHVIVRPYRDEKIRIEFENDRLHLCCRCTEAFLAVRGSIRCRNNSTVVRNGKAALDYLTNAKRTKPSYIINI